LSKSRPRRLKETDAEDIAAPPDHGPPARALANDEHGANAIEYALIASGGGAAVASAVYQLGSTTQGLYSHLSSLFG
jgi:Flp pilus assembly pilin Flp